jgi:hypothetical protein
VSNDRELILEKMDQLIQLVAIALVENRKQRDQIRLLALGGIKPVRIAEILRTTSNTVNVALSSLRSEGKLPKGAKRSNGKS